MLDALRAVRSRLQILAQLDAHGYGCQERPLQPKDLLVVWPEWVLALLWGWPEPCGLLVLALAGPSCPAGGVWPTAQKKELGLGWQKERQ